MRFGLFLVCLALFANLVLSREFKEMLFAGYQGWFNTPRNSIIGMWFHWAWSKPSPGNIHFEIYPDVSDFPEDTLEETDLGPLHNGQPSKLYQSDTDGVVGTHFSWMKTYGIDGIALQRYVNELMNPTWESWRNSVLSRVMKFSTQYDRYFYIMYDITGAPEGTFVTKIVSDWEYLVNTLKVTSHPLYAKQNGKPVIAIWGFGIPDRPGTADNALQLTTFFKSKGCYVILAAPYRWRAGYGSKPGFTPSIFAAADMIQPWSVSAYKSTDDLNSALHSDILEGDKEWCLARKVDYQRVIWPGFSWSTWNDGIKNKIPRQGGQFFRDQVNKTLFGAPVFSSMYIAMFDEFDEGTAIAKGAVNISYIPRAQYFLTWDADGFNLPSDHYLKVAGEETEKYHKIVDNIKVLFDKSKTDRMISTRSLRENEFIMSDNLRYKLTLQSNGNAVLIDSVTLNTVWSTNTAGQGSKPHVFTIQSDGNLVLYAQGEPIWASGSFVGSIYGPFVLIVDNNGILKTYDSFNRLIWNSSL